MKGLDAVRNKESKEEARLLVRLGVVQDLLGDSDSATKTLKVALTQFSDTQDRLRATALINLGIIQCARGNVKLGQGYYKQALEIYEQLHDDWGKMGIWQNLAYELDVAGHWAEAEEYYNQEIATAERLGNAGKQFQAWLGLGIISMKRGQSSDAEAHLLRAVGIARQYNLRSDLSYVLPVLADEYLRQNLPDAAEPLLNEAEGIARQTEVHEPLPEIYRNQARLKLARHQASEALPLVDKSIRKARELELASEIGLSMRVSGEIQWALGETDAALVSLQESLSILTERDPYETARTQVVLSKLLKAELNVEHSAELLQEACLAFRRLEAKRDLAQSDCL